MSNVYGITLKNEGKIYYFNGEDLDIEKMSYVVVETEKGIQEHCKEIGFDKGLHR